MLLNHCCFPCQLMMRGLFGNCPIFVCRKYYKEERTLQLTHVYRDYTFYTTCLFTFTSFLPYQGLYSVLGHDPLIFSFLSFLFFDWVGVLWPQLPKVLKPVCWVSSIPFPQCGKLFAEASCLFAVAVSVHVFISGESVSS